MLLPPTQIGGCGCAIGRGSIVLPRAEVATVEHDTVGRPRRDHRVDRLVGELVAFVEVDAERAELRAQVAGRDAEDHPTARQAVEAQHRLRGEERVAVRDDEHVRLQPQRRGRRARDREHDERVERVVTAGLEPPIVGERMIGHVTRGEAGGLGRRRELGDRGAGHELVGRVDAVGRQPDRELHHADQAETGAERAPRTRRPGRAPWSVAARRVTSPRLTVAT